MNYYEHHLGDFVRDASHLSMLEEGAYRRLLDAYYVRESPLPLDISQCKKLARVTRAPAEHRAVEYVLSQFFVKEPDGYHQRRCDEEIQRFRSKSQSGRANANARWNNANASNPHMRNSGGRNAIASNPHPVRNALQTPDSRLQSPVTKHTPPSAPLQGGKRGVGTFKKAGAESLNGNGLARIPDRYAKTTDELEREEASRASE